MASQIQGDVDMDYYDEEEDLDLFLQSPPLPEVDHPPLPPLVQRLSQTNDPPLDDEVTPLRDLLASAEESFRHWIHQSDLLQLDGADVPDEICHQADLAQVFLHDLKAALKGILSPLRRVPAEILAEIMHLARVDADEDLTAVTLDTRGTVWLIAQVCGTWRNVALSLPTLWNTLHFDMPASTSIRNPEVIAAELLRRSGELPLRVTFDDHTTETDDAGKVLNVIIAHCHRWDYFKAAVNAAHLPMFAPVKARLPILRIMILTVLDATPPDFTLDAFEAAPLLKTLFLESDVPAHAMPFPWSQLIQYSTSRSELEPYYHNLTNVYSCIFMGTRYALSTHVPVRLPNLQDLVLNDSTILNHLDLPALTSLNTIERRGNIAIVARCVNRCNAPLKALSLRGDLSLVDVVGQSLAQMPTITIFAIESATFVPGIIPLLTRNGNTDGLNGMGAILPYLTRLHMDIRDARDVVVAPLDSDALVKLVESRWTLPAGYEEGTEGFTRLKSFTFRLSYANGEHSFTQEALARLRALEEEGLVLDLELNKMDD